MATDAFTQFTINPSVNPLEVIELFLKSGWTQIDQGKVSYLAHTPDDDDYDWIDRPCSQWDSVKAEILKKINLSQKIGIQLYFEQVGGIFIFKTLANKNLDVMISWSINRRVLKNNLTDFSYYENELIRTLKSGGLRVEQMKSEQIESDGTQTYKNVRKID